MSREEELAAQGWTRRGVMNEPRLSEVVEVYQSLGFAVRLEPIDPGNCHEPGCDACWQGEGVADQFRVVYTRPGGGPSIDGDRC